MDASIIVAICATVVAVVSLAVSVYEARAMRAHNRHSVRPILELRTSFRPGRAAGLRLTNSGLGPAAITRTSLMLDGIPVGELDESGVNQVRDTLTAVRPAAVTFGETPFLATDYDEYLLKVEDYDPDTHVEFADLLRRRLAVEIHYESLYGGEKFIAALNPVVDPP
jgi:hypothetical protein